MKGCNETVGVEKKMNEKVESIFYWNENLLLSDIICLKNVLFSF
jgi:hypothetical protein